VYAAAGLEALWEHGLLDRISHISSVSGGSIAASYFVANRPGCDEESTDAAKQSCWRAFFTGFKRAMRYDYQWATERRQLRYPNRWTSPTRRASSFQEVLDRKFLAEKTFGDLYAPGTAGAPVLLVNAASYDEARRFVFSSACIGSLIGALRSASFARPGCETGVPMDFPVSLAVAASAAFPGLFGPVALGVPPSCDVERQEWWHLGDGGMIDNSGVDTLEELVLSTVEAGSPNLSTALLISLDASRNPRGDPLKERADYGLFRRDAGRIVLVTKARGEAFHEFAFERRQGDLAAQGVHLDKISMRYMAAELEDWPASCGGWLTDSQKIVSSLVDAIRDRLEAIPTLLSIDDCGADLLELAAHQVVHATLNGEAGERLRALGIPLREARD
jgi:predicted acylesterase/phospholipase RssA